MDSSYGQHGRLLALLAQREGFAGAEELAEAIARAFAAEAVGIQVRVPDGSFQPLAVAATSPAWREELERRLADEARSFASDADLSIDRATAPAAWPETVWWRALPVRTAAGEVAGILALVGDAAGGCPPLSGVECAALENACTLVLAASAEHQRATQLERQLHFVGSISQSLASRSSVIERLKAAVQAAQEALGFDSVQLLTWDPSGRKLLLNVLYTRDDGFMADDTFDRMSRAEIEESSRRFLEDPSPLILANPAEIEDVPEHHRRWMREHGIMFLVFVPLIFEEQHLGTLVLTSHASREGTEQQLRTLTALGGHLGAILQLSLLLTEVEESYRRLHVSHRNTVETLALAAEMRDATTGRHLRNLQTFSVAIGRRLGLSGQELEDVGFAAVVHDIGKLYVPDAVLLKPGRLDSDEREVMRRHPEAGERLLAQSEISPGVRALVRGHHERWDGSGYPDGLRAGAIPIGVQVLTVADVFDALISVRPYKEAWPVERALDEMSRNRGAQFSPDVLDCFLDIVDSLPLDDTPDREAA